MVRSVGGKLDAPPWVGSATDLIKQCRGEWYKGRKVGESGSLKFQV